MNIWYGTPAMTASRTAILENAVASAFPGAVAAASADTGRSGRSIARFMLLSSHSPFAGGEGDTTVGHRQGQRVVGALLELGREDRLQNLGDRLGVRRALLETHDDRRASGTHLERARECVALPRAAILVWKWASIADSVC